jgi:hypothetical protein
MRPAKKVSLPVEVSVQSAPWPAAPMRRVCVTPPGRVETTQAATGCETVMEPMEPVRATLLTGAKVAVAGEVARTPS